MAIEFLIGGLGSIVGGLATFFLTKQKQLTESESINRKFDHELIEKLQENFSEIAGQLKEARSEIAALRKENGELFKKVAILEANTMKCPSLRAGMEPPEGCKSADPDPFPTHKKKVA